MTDSAKCANCIRPARRNDLRGAGGVDRYGTSSCAQGHGCIGMIVSKQRKLQQLYEEPTTMQHAVRVCLGHIYASNNQVSCSK